MTAMAVNHNSIASKEESTLPTSDRVRISKSTLKTPIKGRHGGYTGSHNREISRGAIMTKKSKTPASHKSGYSTKLVQST